MTSYLESTSTRIDSFMKKHAPYAAGALDDMLQAEVTIGMLPAELFTLTSLTHLLLCHTALYYDVTILATMTSLPPLL